MTRGTPRWRVNLAAELPTPEAETPTTAATGRADQSRLRRGEEALALTGVTHEIVDGQLAVGGRGLLWCGWPLHGRLLGRVLCRHHTQSAELLHPQQRLRTKKH